MTVTMTWPPMLPSVSNSFAFRVETDTLRTTMDSGRARQRSRSTKEVVMARATWEFSDLEFRVFQSFYKHRIGNGADWFICELALGNRLQNYVVRFTGEGYQNTHRPVLNWNVSANLEVEELGVMNSDELSDEEVLYEFAGSEEEFIDTSVEFNVLINSTLPNHNW